MAEFIQYRTRASLYDGPFNSVVGWSAAGMGDVIVSNGLCSVIDGGRTEDAEDLIALLEQEMGPNPVVEQWIITHPHNDHYGAVCRICHTPELLARVRIKEFIYLFPDEFETRSGAFPNPEHNRRLSECVSLSGAEYHAPEIGEKYSLGDAETEVLYTPYDCRILNRCGNENFCSMILSVKGRGKRVIVTGDANGRNMQVCAWLHRKQLAADVLQMPHHGLCDTYNLDFYREVNAKTLLVPTSIAGNRAMHDGSYSGAGIDAIRWCEENAGEIFRAFDGTVSLEI